MAYVEFDHLEENYMNKKRMRKILFNIHKCNFDKSFSKLFTGVD
jgi:hypothetical protein